MGIERTNDPNGIVTTTTPGPTVTNVSNRRATANINQLTTPNIQSNIQSEITTTQGRFTNTPISLNLQQSSPTQPVVRLTSGTTYGSERLTGITPFESGAIESGLTQYRAPERGFDLNANPVSQEFTADSNFTYNPEVPNTSTGETLESSVIGNATKSDPGGGDGAGGGSGEGSGGSGKRQIDCPYCSGEVQSEENGRATRNPTLFPRIQNIIAALSDFITALFGGTKTVSREQAAYDGETCKMCGGKGSYDDPSDVQQEQQAAANYLAGQSERMFELEGQMGSPIGGSRTERIAGDEMLIVGQEFNNAKTYKVVQDGLKVPGNMVVKEKGRAAVPQGGKCNAIVGLNPPANSAGGNYTIIVGNHYKLYTGAQGINIHTNGPLSIDGGITSFTGAEVTVGSSLGQTALEGNHLLLQGKHITVNPMNDNKQMSIMGSVAATGNVQAGGAYFDNLYFVKGSCPADQKPTKVGSTTDLISGPAQWSVTGRNLELAFRNLKKWLIDCTTDPVLTDATGVLTPRGILKINDNLKNLKYGLLPLEQRVTGVCFGLGVGFTVGVVINFPHTHGFPDAPHSHVITMPAIACDTNERAEAVRKAADAAGINGPVAAVGMVGSYFANLFKAGAAFVGAVLGLEGAINDDPYST